MSCPDGRLHAHGRTPSEPPPPPRRGYSLGLLTAWFTSFGSHAAVTAWILLAPPVSSAHMKIEAAAPRAGNPNPEYPASARRHGVEGREALLVDIRADGTVAGVEIAESSSHDALDAAAALAVRRWLFRPARRDGDAIDWRARIPVVFRLLD